jgi:hypothetical protein
VTASAIPETYVNSAPENRIAFGLSREGPSNKPPTSRNRATVAITMSALT